MVSMKNEFTLIYFIFAPAFNKQPKIFQIKSLNAILTL